MKRKRHYVSVREDVYERLAAEAAKRKVTIAKLVLESLADVVGDDQLAAARRRYRRWS